MIQANLQPYPCSNSHKHCLNEGRISGIGGGGGTYYKGTTGVGLGIQPKESVAKDNES